MPWPERQRRAIFLSTKRRKGATAAKRVMHEAGYGGDKVNQALRRAGRSR